MRWGIPRSQPAEGLLRRPFAAVGVATPAERPPRRDDRRVLPCGWAGFFSFSPRHPQSCHATVRVSCQKGISSSGMFAITARLVAADGPAVLVAFGVAVAGTYRFTTALTLPALLV